MYKLILYICLIVLYLSCPCNTVDDLEVGTPLEMLSKTITALEHLTSFFQKNIEKANLDAIYGIRVAQGILQKCLKNQKSSTGRTPQYIWQRLKNIHSQVVHVAKQSQIFIQRQDGSYYKRFKYVVDKPWGYVVGFGQRKLPVSLTKNLSTDTEKRSWNEEMSDRCMSEVMGTNKKHRKCTLTPTCAVAITDRSHALYGSTHQVLFLTLALLHKCDTKYSHIFNKMIGMNVHAYIENRCVKILHEMLEIEKYGIITDDHDLYFEQAMVCGMQGYAEFLSYKRLKNVLSWQLYPGCYGNTSDYDMEQDNQRAKRDSWKTQGHEGHSTMRRLLVDATLDHGCSSHESGVAIALLGLYIKWELFELDRNTVLVTARSVQKEPERTNRTTHKEEMNKITDKLNYNNVKNVPKRSMYLAAIFIAFITSIVTVVLACILYKLCSKCSKAANKYKKLKRCDKGNNYIA